MLDRAKAVQETLEAIDLARSDLLARLRAGDADVRISDLPALVKLERLVTGEATERIDVAEVRFVFESIATTAIRFIAVDRHGEFLEALRGIAGWATFSPPVAELEAGDAA